jgi:hypothetical protein
MSLSLLRKAAAETRPGAGRTNSIRFALSPQLSPAAVLGSLSSVALSPAQAAQFSSARCLAQARPSRATLTKPDGVSFQRPKSLQS